MGNWSSKSAGSNPTNAKYILSIEYNDNGVNGPKAIYVKKYVAKKFKDKIQVVLQKQSYDSSNFEINISSKSSGKSSLVHSKRNGDGDVNAYNIETLCQKLSDFCAF